MEIETIVIRNLPCHFDECLNCGRNECSVTMSEYGICLNCAKSFDTRKHNRGTILAISRLLMFRASQILAKEDEPSIKIS